MSFAYRASKTYSPCCVRCITKLPLSLKWQACQSLTMYVSRRQRYMSFSVYLLRCIIRTVTLIKRLKTTFKILKSHHPHCHNYIFCSFFSSRQINEWWSFPQSLQFGAGHCLMSCFTFFRDFKPKPYFFTLSRLSFLDILFLNCRQLEAAP